MLQSKSILSLLTFCGAFSPLHAQTPSTTQQRADLQDKISALDAQTLAEIQKATDSLQSALLKGDANAALAWLAPDFGLGNYQYRPRDLDWMKGALPAQLARARFAELQIKLSSVEQRDGKTVAQGRIEARTQINNGEKIKIGGISGGYGAFWTPTPEGWRLSRDDTTFNSLTQVALWDVAPMATRFAGPKPAPGLPRENPAVVLEQAHQGQVEPIAFSPDGKILATYGVYDRLRFASAQTGAFQNAMKTPMSINSMAFAPDGTLVTGHNDGRVRCWDVEKSLLKREFAVSKWSVYAVKISPDGKTLAADGAGKVQLWNIENGQKAGELGDSKGNIRSLDFSPDGKTIAFTSNAGVELWDMASAKRLQLFPNAELGAFSRDGATLAVNEFGGLKFYNAQNGALQRQIAVPNPLKHIFPKPGEAGFSPLQGNGLFYAPDAQIAPDLQRAASIYADGSIGIWNTQTGELKQQLRGFQSDTMGGDVSQIAFSPDGSRLAVGSRSGETAIWILAP